jgi:hypothetical protein
VTYASLDNRIWTQTTVQKVGSVYSWTVLADGNPLQNPTPTKPIGQVVLVVNDTIYVGIQSFYGGGATNYPFEWTPPAGVTVTKATLFYSGYDAPPAVPATPSYRPSQGTLSMAAHGWSALTPMPDTISADYDRSAVSVGSQIFAFGGLQDGSSLDALRFDTTATGNAWTFLEDVSAPTITPSPAGYGRITAPVRAAVGSDGLIYTVSLWFKQYYQSGDLVQTNVLSIEQRDAQGGIIQVFEAIPTSIWWIQAMVSIGDSLYILGDDQPSMIVFTPSTGVATSEAGAPNRAIGFGAAAVNGKLYVMGGHIYSDLASFSATSAVYEYNPTVSSGLRWNIMEHSMQVPRYGFGTAVLNGQIYTIGGITDENADGWSPVSAVEVFTPSTDQWGATDPMVPALAWPAAVAAEGRIYVFSGDVAINHPAELTILRYTP